MNRNQFTALPKWTPEEDATIRSLWGKLSTTHIARQTGFKRYRILARARRLNLEIVPFKDVLTPSKAEWVAIATQKAQEARVSPSLVMSGSKRKGARSARWEAWKAILEANPGYSIAGLGRVSGFDHTAILHAMKRLNGASAKSIRQPAYRVSFHKNIDCSVAAE